MTGQTSQEPNGIVLESQNARRGDEHHRPPLQALLVRHAAVDATAGLDTRLPEVRRAVVEALSHLGQLEAGGDDHDAQERVGERLDQAEQGLPEHQAEDDLEEAQEDDARSAARAEAVLRRQTAGAVAHGHGAEPAAEQVHERHADAELGHARIRQVGQQVGRESAGSNDGVEGRQRQLRNAHANGIGTPIWNDRVGAPESKPRECIVRSVAQVISRENDESQDYAH